MSSGQTPSSQTLLKDAQDLEEEMKVNGHLPQLSGELRSLCEHFEATLKQQNELLLKKYSDHVCSHVDSLLASRFALNGQALSESLVEKEGFLTPEIDDSNGYSSQPELPHSANEDFEEYAEVVPAFSQQQDLQIVQEAKNRHEAHKDAAVQGKKLSLVSLDSTQRVLGEYFGRRDQEEMEKQQQQRQEQSDLWWRRYLRKLVSSDAFEAFFALVIMTNSVVIGAQVEFNAQAPGESLPAMFLVLEYCYALMFLAEAVMRVVADPRTFFCGLKGVPILSQGNLCWNYLDLVIVSTSILEAVFSIALVGTDDGSSKSVVIRYVRILRLVRVIRIMKVIRFIGGLRTLVQSILGTLKSLMWSIILLLIIMYVFSILFTDAVTSQVQDSLLLDEIDTVDSARSLVSSHEIFGTLFLSMSTLYQSISGGMDWSDAYHPLLDLGWPWGAFFMSYVAFCYFAVLNVMAGVFCQSAIESANRDPDTIRQKFIAEQERVQLHAFKLFTAIDKDGDGCISLSEFLTGLADSDVQGLLEVLDLDAEDPPTLFKLLGASRLTSELTFSSFLKGIKSLRGQARALQVAKVVGQSELASGQMAQIRQRILSLEKCLKSTPKLQAGNSHFETKLVEGTSSLESKPSAHTKNRL
mmetsp:Transcript_778/g.1443  ORF Transcript_778/g.1443 Transcript_778/m.1443 type:complete len:639 (+) Transcript_778:127-2043(+)|eukprot:CAMPEP_0197625582 /NCGR_PEP_ID=MMETSP1338-20131121/4907_1 /TAXON_ID=43686 ORGANISM="Pelagodinium beii, Strain RCC1491" /NCGR_SAMPLE_ID=MMETSP1338 /ASSEMBLY_ACC=CAM_ASM_000754 /LENGTH=638 /DNA_ID=CAMNT_0043196027 /DNA_START=108 /DNA_END=2024 /DNA_ORIENTATION=+